MNLYHYATAPHDELKTRKALGLKGPEGVKVSDNYLNHISFFFDPIPSKLMPEIFTQGHPVWFKGNTLYEHTIDTASLEERILYRVVESFKETALFDEFAQEHHWVRDDPVLLKQWETLLNKKQAEWGEVAMSRRKLEQQITAHKGCTHLGYMAAAQRPDFQEGYNKYAANVPHLMLYPHVGEIKVTLVSELKIGDNKRTPVGPPVR